MFYIAQNAWNSSSVQVIQRGTRSAGYGFVTVKDTAQVQKAVEELNKQDLDGRSIIVEAAKPAEDKEKERSQRRNKKRAAGRRGNKAPPGEVTEAEANGEAPESAPEVPTGEEKPRKRTKKPVRVFAKSLGYFANRIKNLPQRKPKAKKTPATETDSAAAAAESTAPAPEIEAPAEAAPKKPRRPRAPKTPRAEGEQPEGEPSKSVLFVANLAFNVDDATLAELFTSAGIDVVSARVVRRRFGRPRRSKGYGFVDVGTEEQQQKALEVFAGKEVNGREIAVKVAVSSPTANGNTSDGGAPTIEETEDSAPADSTLTAY